MGSHPREISSECSRSRVLYMVAVSGKPLTCGDIADRLGVAWNNVNQALLALSDAGLIRRTGDGGQTDPYRYVLAETEVVEA